MEIESAHAIPPEAPTMRWRWRRDRRGKRRDRRRTEGETCRLDCKKQNCDNGTPHTSYRNAPSARLPRNIFDLLLGLRTIARDPLVELQDLRKDAPHITQRAARPAALRLSQA